MSLLRSAGVGRSVGGPAAGDSGLDTCPLVLFFLLAFAISWASFSIPVLPLFGPLLAAVIVTATTAGRDGLRSRVFRMWRWRVPIRWWLVAISPVLFLLVTLAG